MSRKKQTKRKVKVTDSHSRHSPKPSESNSMQTSSDRPLPNAKNFHSEPAEGSTQQSSQCPGQPPDKQRSIHQSSMFVPLMMIKTESNVEVDHQTCTRVENTCTSAISAQESSNIFKPAKIKRERLSLDSSITSRSIHQLPNSTPTMDLGSHLEQSLSSIQSGSDLTWSQLLEAKNFPKVQIPGNVQKDDVVIKTEKPDHPVIVVSSKDCDSESKSLETSADQSSILGKSTSLHLKENSSLSGSSKRFSKNHDSGSGGNLLDLSKKSIPLEIKRVLASKYGVTKRHDEGYLGSVVPNLNKSRSRFTHSSRKAGVTDSEDEGNSQSKSFNASSVDTGENSKRRKEEDGSFTQTSTSSLSEKGTLSSSIPKSKSVSPTEYSGLKALNPVAGKVISRRRFSSSAYEGRRSAQPNRGDKLVADKLQSRGLLDLGSHYGSLLKDSPPPLTGRNSKSPYDESTTSRSQSKITNATGNTSCLDERRGTVQESKLVSQMALNDFSSGAGLSGGVRRISLDAGEKSLRGETVRYEGSKELDQGKSVSRRMSNSPANINSETRNPAETMIGLGSTSRSNQRKDTQHSSTRSSSRSPLVPPMIDLNTSTRHLNERVSRERGRSPFSSSYGNEAPGHDYQKSTNRDIPRSSSRSPMSIERPRNTPTDTKEGMIELGSGKVLHDYLERAKQTISRSSSRSPVSAHQLSDTCSPVAKEPMIELGSGHLMNEDLNAKRFIPSRTSSRSPVATHVAGKTGSNEDEPMIELNSMTRQPRSTSQSPHSNSGAARSEEPMIDLGRVVGSLHERRGAPRMKPLDAMIDLSSMENPVSPLSPGVGSLPFSSFPSQVYRPHNRSRYRYQSKYYRGSPRNSSPGFSPRLPFGPRFHYPSNPRYRLPGAPMIDLGSVGKSNDFQGMVSSRLSEVPLRPLEGRSSEPTSKRKHSLDSSNETAKRPRVVVPDQRPEVKVEGSGVRLNVNDLLHLEREEQKYIQDLSLVQSQLTEIRFKMQRMQQDLEKLQSSEGEIKQRIDVVRAERVKILKDAQDHVESQGRKGTPDISNEGDVSTRRGNEGDEERDVAYCRGSLGFERYRAGRGHDVVESVPESERKDTQAPNDGNSTEFRTTGGGFGKKHDIRENVKLNSLEKNLDKKKVTDSSSLDGLTERNKDTYENTSENRHVVPSELVLRSSSGSSNKSNPVLSTYDPGVLHTQHYPVTSSSKSRSNLIRPKAALGRAGCDRSLQETQDKISNEIETFESSDGSTITLNSDGTLVIRKNQTESNQLARKRTNTIVMEALEGVCADFDAKRTESEGSQQFLGCLEITSTTDEPLVAEDDGPKEVLAEKERECLASKLRCDRDRISSTVPSLETDQDDASIGSASEMDFLGHTDAVCFILPYKGKLFSASADRTVKAFDLKTGKCIKTFEGHDLAVNCLQISGCDGKAERLFTGANDQTVRAYNVKSAACSHKFSFRGRVMCLLVAFGKLFVGLSSGFVAVIDLKTNECVDQFNCHEPSRISCLASATEGQRSLLCTGSFDSTITVRDESTGLLLRHIKDHKLTVLCMQVVENILYSGSADTVVQSHNINTGELVRSYTGHTMSVSGLHAQGGVLVTSSLDRIIRCFDIKTGDLLQLYGGNTDMIFSLSVVGDMIYTGCRDGRVSGIKLDLRKYHCCKWGDCSLKFGLLNHLKQHVQDHINQTVDFKECFWEDCIHKFPRGKQLDVIQAATKHILGHLPNSEF